MTLTLESPLDSKEIKPINLKGNQSWIFIGRTDAEDEAPTLWPPDVKSNSLGKILMLGKTEGKRTGQQRTLHEHEFEQNPGDGEGQESLWAAVRGITGNDWATEQLQIVKNLYICHRLKQ